MVRRGAIAPTAEFFSGKGDSVVVVTEGVDPTEERSKGKEWRRVKHSRKPS